jgi:hypothetical protein
MEVSYGITSRLRVLDGDLDRVAVKLQRLGMLGRDAGVAINKGLTAALRGPGGALAAIGEVEKRLQNLGRGRAGESFLDRTIWRIKQMEDRGRRGAQGIEAARLRLLTGQQDSDLAGLRLPRTPAGGGGGGGAGLLGMAAGMGPVGAMLATAGGMALYNGLVGAMRMTTDALIGTAQAFHSINREAERGVVALQGAFMSADGMDASLARSRALSTFQRLERAAASGPGETADYLGAFQRIYTPLRQRGASMGQIEELTRQSIAAGEVVRPGMGKVLGPMDIYQALTSGVNVQQTPIANMALQNAGYSLDDYRGAAPGKQIQMLLEGFATYNSAIAELAKSVTAQEDTLSDNLKRMVRAMSPDAFEAYRVGLLESNRIMDGLNAENSTVRDGLRETTRALSAIATDVGRGFDQGVLSRLPDLGNSLTSLGKQLGILRDDSQSLSVAFGELMGGGIVNLVQMMAEAASLSTMIGTRMVNNPGRGFAVNSAMAAYEWMNMPRLPGLNEEGIPLSLLQPGTGADDGIPEMLRKPEALGTAVGAAAGRELGKGRSPLKLDVNVEWGSDRSLAIAFQSVADQVARQLTRMPLGSSQVGAFQSFG